jgi:tetratricopeptide (TPR) repeat protein
VFKKIGRRTGSQKAFDWSKKNAELVSLIHTGNVKEAMRLGQDLVEHVDRTYRKDSKEKATSYNNMGMVFMLVRDYPLAEKCFQEALEMRKRLFGENHNEVAIIFLNLSELYKREAEEIMAANRVETKV